MMVLSKNGYEAIEEKIRSLMGTVTAAMQKDCDDQVSALRSIRSVIFDLSNTIKTHVIITQDDQESRLMEACGLLREYLVDSFPVATPNQAWRQKVIKFLGPSAASAAAGIKEALHGKAI